MFKLNWLFRKKVAAVTPERRIEDGGKVYCKHCEFTHNMWCLNPSVNGANEYTVSSCKLELMAKSVKEANKEAANKDGTCKHYQRKS